MTSDYSPSIPDIPFVDPSTRALLSEVLDRLAAVEEENRQIKTALEERDDEIAALREEIALERAYDRRRIARLEEPAPALSQKTAGDHLDKLFSEMKRLSIRQVTMRDAARLLGVSKRQMKDVKPYLADNSRFVIVKDPHHKQRHLIRLV